MNRTLNYCAVALVVLVVLCALLMGCAPSPTKPRQSVEEESDAAYMARSRESMDKWWAEAQERARKNPPPEPKPVSPEINGRSNFVHILDTLFRAEYCNTDVRLEGDKSDVLVLEGIFTDPWGSGERSHIYQNCIEREIILPDENRILIRKLKFTRIDIIDVTSHNRARLDVKTWEVQ